MRTVSTKTIIQPFCPQLQRYEMRFSDGERFILRAFDAACAEHLACAARLASGGSLECISFRRELSDEEITPRFLTALSRELPELTANDLGERLLTTTEAAAFLGTSEQAVHKRTSTGRLRSFKVGGRCLFSRVRHLAPVLRKKGKSLPTEAPAEAAPPRYLNLPETAYWLGTSRQTINQLIRTGALGSVKEGRRRRISIEEHLVPYLRSCER